MDLEAHDLIDQEPAELPLRWRPTWAMVLAVLGILAGLGPVGVGLWMIVPAVAGIFGPNFLGSMVVTIVGMIVLVSGGIGVWLLAWFLRRGGPGLLIVGVLVVAFSSSFDSIAPFLR